MAESRKRELVAERRLAGGSRFNLRYEDAVPSGIRPEEVMAALAQYVDFSPGGFPRRGMTVPPAPAALLPRKGMTRAEAEREFGPPVNATEHREGGLMVTTLRFVSRDQQITADFVEDIMVRFSMSSGSAARARTPALHSHGRLVNARSVRLQQVSVRQPCPVSAFGWSKIRIAEVMRDGLPGR